jgi:hypothetical protein
MPGLVPGIYVLAKKEDVDGRDKPGHDAFIVHLSGARPPRTGTACVERFIVRS